MQYMSVKEAANRWNVSERNVRYYCEQGRVQGAFLTGKTWNIPEDAAKPIRKNARKKSLSPLLEKLRTEKETSIKGSIYHNVQVDMTYNSNRIEGSKLSIDQTRLIFETKTIGLSDVSLNVDDLIETANHFRAIDYIIDNVELPLSGMFIKELHRILKSSTTDASLDWFAVGEYKKLPNEVSGLETCAPEKVSNTISKLIGTYEKKEYISFEDIIEFHVNFERIHPFQDGNGRIGRLIMFKECLRHRIVPFIIEDAIKAFYYRGLNEWDTEKGYLVETCLSAQDKFKSVLDYFRIGY